LAGSFRGSFSNGRLYTAVLIGRIIINNYNHLLADLTKSLQESRPLLISRSRLNGLQFLDTSASSARLQNTRPSRPV